MRHAVKTIYLLFLAIGNLQGQQTYTVSGYVKDLSSGETLIGAGIYLKSDPGRGTTSNTYGFYSLTLDSGSYELVCRYLGYKENSFQIQLDSNRKKDIYLDPGIEIQEVVVTAEEEEDRNNVESASMGVISLKSETIKKIPVVFGETDLLKTIQLLPGVLSSGEGNAGFFVRGGGADQNLVLLDEAVVYNTGHLFGFFSVFNADAIKKSTLYKGDLPAEYGGRLSSVLDIQMKDGNDREFAAEGGVGTISSRLTFEGPVIQERSSFLLSARRTYLFDLASPALDGGSFEGTNYFFYDLKAKVSHQLDKNNRLFLSGYYGRDVLDFAAPRRGFFFRMPYGNSTTTLRWNHVYNDKLFSNLSLIYNQYDFEFNAEQDDFRFGLFSGIRDVNAKLDFDYFLSPAHRLKFGLNYTWHKLSPFSLSGSEGDAVFNNNLEPKYAHESALYISDEFSPGDKLKIKTGFRISMLNHMGPYADPVSGREYGEGEHVKSYVNPEPRLTLRYKLTPSSSIKGGVTLSSQYIHLVSNSTSTLPTDIWVPSTAYVRPQKGIQYSLGYFRNFDRNRLKGSVEMYYRSLDNQIDYRDDYVDNASGEVENDFVFGQGQAYGLEFLLKKEEGRLTGWIGYTLSKSERWFDRIEKGRKYPASFDKPHDLSVVLNYALSEKWQVGTNFVYGTGSPFTPISGVYFIEQKPNLIYGPRNSSRLEDYHRLDLAVSWTPNPDPQKKFTSTWTFSVYNLYNRKNPFFIYSDFSIDDEQAATNLEAYKVALFPVIPSITWNFKWKQK